MAMISNGGSLVILLAMDELRSSMVNLPRAFLRLVVLASWLLPHPSLRVFFGYRRKHLPVTRLLGGKLFVFRWRPFNRSAEALLERRHEIDNICS